MSILSKRPWVSSLWAGALFFGIALGAASSRADSTAPPSVVKEKEKPAKVCKTTADCDQSGGRTVCRDAKCQADRVPPPT